VTATRPLVRLRRYAEDRGLKWARRRQGPDLLPTTLAARRLYILPTRAGVALAALLLTMLVAGLNYNNSLALLLTFLLAGFTLVGLYQTHRRLLGIAVQGVDLTPAFAGELLTVSVQLGEASGLAAAEYVLRLRPPGAEPVEAAADGEAASPAFRLYCPAALRGLWILPTLCLQCTAPMGLFRVWTWLHIEASTPIYPRLTGTLPLPESPGDDSGSRDPASGNDEWAALRPFRDGDSPRQVAWKAYARGAPLLVKEYRGLSGQHHEFDYDRLPPGLDVEARLSQLATWVVESERRGETYGLVLRGRRLAADSGPQQLRACLTALALFGHPGADRPR
jgi:uncharacterized protein (DUF58 family)